MQDGTGKIARTFGGKSVGRLVAFAGRKHSGKTSAAEHAAELLGAPIRHVGGVLSELLECTLDYRGATPDEAEWYTYGHGKDTPCPYLNGQTPRSWLQVFGNGMRAHWKHMLVDSELRNLALSERPGTWVVLHGVRFANEANQILAQGGHVIVLHRAPFAESERHSTELAVDELYELRHNRVEHWYNQNWSKPTLEYQVQNLVDALRALP